MFPHLRVSCPRAPIPKQPPDVADVVGIVALCPFPLQLFIFGRDFSGLPLAAARAMGLLRLSVISRNCGPVIILISLQVGLNRRLVNAVAWLEFGDGHGSAIRLVIVICSIRLAKRARARCDSTLHPL